MPAARPVLGALALVGLLATACTNSESAVQKNPHSGVGTATVVNGVQRITVTTGSDLRFHPSTLVVHRGKVQITLVNKAGSSGGPPHNLEVAGIPGADVPTIETGQSATATFIAPSVGRYHFVCSIHVQQGQTGTLVVERGAAGS